MRNNFLLFLVFCLTAGLGIGQNQPVTEPTPADKLSEEKELKEQIRRERIFSLKTQAELQPVELAADTLFRMLDAGLITEQQQKVQVLEWIFNRAGEAKNTIKLKNFHRTVDSRSGYQSKTHALELDRLSIQLKVVGQLLKFDKHRARETFSAIPQLKLPQLKCEDSMLPEVDRFYTTLGNVIEQGFDAEAKEQKQDMYFAGSYIDRIRSPLELKPAAEMLAKINVSKEAFDLLLHRYNIAMGRMSADPRSLAIALRFHKISDSIKETLYSREGNTPLTSKELIENYRKMLVSSLSKEQCADYLFVTEVRSDDPALPPKKTVHASIASMNDILEHPITAEEIETKDVGARSDEYEFWKRPKSAKLLLEGQKLNFASDGRTRLTAEQKRDQEWIRQLMNYRQFFADWKPEDEESEADHFDQKNVLYIHLLTITRDNESLMSEIMMEYGIFMRDSPVFKKMPAEWLKYANDFRRPMSSWSDERKKRFYEMLTSSSSEGFSIMFELEKLISEKN